MPFPPLVVTGQVISAAHINAIRNALATWPGDVSADGYDLGSVGSITAADLTLSGGTLLRMSGTDFKYAEIHSQHLAIYKKQGAHGVFWRSSASGFTSDVSFTSMLAITDDGCGIGIEDPSALLHIYSAAADAAKMVISTNQADQLYQAFIETSSGNLKFVGTQTGFSGYQFWTRKADASYVQALKIFASGHIEHAPPNTFADNAAAIAGGLGAGTWYRTATGQMMVVY